MCVGLRARHTEANHTANRTFPLQLTRTKKDGPLSLRPSERRISLTLSRIDFLSGSRALQPTAEHDALINVALADHVRERRRSADVTMIGVSAGSRWIGFLFGHAPDVVGVGGAGAVAADNGRRREIHIEALVGCPRLCADDSDVGGFGQVGLGIATVEACCSDQFM